MFTLGPDESPAKLSSDLVPDDHSSDRRRRNSFNRLILKMCCQRRTKIRRVSCGLQRNRALQVDRTVHPARQKKMSFEQCSGLPESLYDLNFIHKKLFSRSSYLISENTQSTITITSVERPL